MIQQDELQKGNSSNIGLMKYQQDVLIQCHKSL